MNIVAMHLIDELLEMRCGRIDALQIVVQGKLGQRFPGRGEGVYFHWIDPAATVASSSDATDAATTTRRRLAMPDRTGSDQRDALHGTKAQLPSILLLLLYLFHQDGLLLVLAALVLEPNADDSR